MPNYPTRDGFKIPMPKPGDGTKIVCHPDGTMTCSWDRPTMALDAALGSKPMGYGSADDYPDDFADNSDIDDNPAAPDLQDNIRALLEGRLDDADLEMLIKLIQPDDNTASMPAQDRRRQARDAMPSRATMARLVAEGAVRRAEQAQKQTASLMQRFPALKGARVV